nr:MAG TPA: hypothetical protein [Caudoviricetes sp.]
MRRRRSRSALRRSALLPGRSRTQTLRRADR